MSWRTLFLEINPTGELCSGIIICWRKSSGEMSPGEIFPGEKCDEFCETYPPSLKSDIIYGWPHMHFIHLTSNSPKGEHKVVNSCMNCVAYPHTQKSSTICNLTPFCFICIRILGGSTLSYKLKKFFQHHTYIKCAFLTNQLYYCMT